MNIEREAQNLLIVFPACYPLQLLVEFNGAKLEEKSYRI
jgi:hypothetical protein